MHLVYVFIPYMLCTNWKAHSNAERGMPFVSPMILLWSILFYLLYDSFRLALKPSFQISVDPLVLLGPDQLGPHKPTTHLSQPMSLVHTLIQCLSSGQTSEETTSKHIPSTIRIHNLRAVEFGYRVRFGVLVRRGKVGRGGGRG